MSKVGISGETPLVNSTLLSSRKEDGPCPNAYHIGCPDALQNDCYITLRDDFVLVVTARSE